MSNRYSGSTPQPDLIWTVVVTNLPNILQQQGNRRGARIGNGTAIKENLSTAKKPPERRPLEFVHFQAAAAAVKLRSVGFSPRWATMFGFSVISLRSRVIRSSAEGLAARRRHLGSAA